MIMLFLKILTILKKWINMVTIRINGQTYFGHSIKEYKDTLTIQTNNAPIVLTKSNFDKEINITIEGDVSNVETMSADVIVLGNVNSNVRTTSGSIKIGGDVTSSITSVSGNIIVKKSVSGSVNTVSGDIKIANNV